MKHKLTIIFTIIATPLVIAKLIDVHVPCKEEIYMEHMRDKERENRQAYDKLRDENATEQEKSDACHKLMDNGVMA